MTTIKNTTKAGQAIINEFNYYQSKGRRGIYEAYGSPSSRKVNSYNEIERRASETNGYNHDLTVAGAGSHFFSTLYSFCDEVGKMFIVKDTASNTYIVEA